MWTLRDQRSRSRLTVQLSPSEVPWMLSDQRVHVLVFQLKTIVTPTNYDSRPVYILQRASRSDVESVIYCKGSTTHKISGTGARRNLKAINAASYWPLRVHVYTLGVCNHWQRLSASLEDDALMCERNWVIDVVSLDSNMLDSVWKTVEVVFINNWTTVSYESYTA